MRSRQYRVGDLRRAITEAKDDLNKEFKPLVYNQENEKINKDAYKEMESATKNYDGGARKEKNNINYPFTDNKGMEDLRYDNNPSKETLDRFKAQREGYIDGKYKKDHEKEPLGNAVYTNIDGIDDHVKMMKNGNVKGKTIGLTSREIPEKDFKNLNKTVANEGKIKKLTFKNTTFLTENHVLSRIPDNYKTEGNKFLVKDKANNEFLVEWHIEDDPIVTNRTRINEQKNRIKELFNYQRGDSNTTSEIRLTEDSNVTDMINKARKLMI